MLDCRSSPDVLTTLLNPIVPLLAVVCVAAARASRRGARASDVMDPMASLARRPTVCAVAILAAALTAGPRIVLGYLAPGSYAEEVVSARTLLEGTGTRSANDREAFRQWLAEEPAPVVPWALPGLSSCQANALENRGHFFTAQGHTPFLLIMSVPVVAAFGGRGTFVVLTLGSVAALLLIGARVVGAGRRNAVALASTAALLACWQPVLATLRQGDVALLVVALIVLTWDALERGETIRAGLSAGLAGSISAGALPLALAVFVYSRRSGVVALTTVLLATAASIAIAGPLVVIDYVDAVRATGAAYASAPFNYTLAGRLPGTAAAVAALALAGGMILSIRSSKPAAFAAGDRLALAVAAVAITCPLLSPVAWSQHLSMLALPAFVLATRIRDRGAGWLCALALLLLAASLPDRPIAWTANVLAPAPLKNVWPPLPLVSSLVLAAWVAAELRLAGARLPAASLAA